MIKKINIEKYRKLENIEFEFSPYLNVISGTNGTCKTSILHIVSNSFKAATKGKHWIGNDDCLDVMKSVNISVNPKIETLTKGDKIYNDPANGHKGELYEVEYFDDKMLKYRRHNSQKEEDSYRYAVKPYYGKNKGENLPICPIIYLGLSRLFPYGEYDKESSIKKIRKTFPEEYQDQIKNLYQSLTGIDIQDFHSQVMGEIKARVDFESQTAGIDSNTISSGEDNILIIIVALISLKYYYESIKSNNQIESILLIDELDATLHPSVQLKLLDVMRSFSKNYKIQIIFTTHSLTTIEHMLGMKQNLIYLVDNVTSVVKMEEPDIYKIKMHLYDLTKEEIYLGRKIPVFTEDEEARDFLNIMFDYFETEKNEFSKVRRYFHFVDANIGSDNLKNIFADSYLLKSTMKSICILDGDQQSNLNNYTIALPGGNSPEEVIMKYSLEAYDSDYSFWTDKTIIDLNQGKAHFRSSIQPDIENIKNTIQEKKKANESVHGLKRKLNKEIYRKHKRFFELLYKYWMYDEENEVQISKFYNNLLAAFKKVAEFHNINPKEWEKEGK